MIKLILTLLVAVVAGVMTANFKQFGWDVKTVFYMHQYGFALAFPVVAVVVVKAFFIDARKMEERADATASARLKEKAARLEKEHQRKVAEVEKLEASNKQRQRGLIDLEAKTRKLYELQLRDMEELEVRKVAMSEAEQLFAEVRGKVQKKNMPPAAIQDRLSRLDKKEAEFKEHMAKVEPSQGVV